MTHVTYAASVMTHQVKMAVPSVVLVINVIILFMDTLITTNIDGV